MAFQQLYYTSCEHGLSGYAGYQFNAVTPGLPGEVLRDVESLVGYEPPSSVGYNPTAADIADAPVNLCYRPGKTTVVANVRFVGADFSQRFGNYFAHALVTTDPDRDLNGVAPIELWRAPFWASQPVDTPELPELPELSGLTAAPPGGATDREAVARFLAGHPAADQLPALLSAVDRAVESGDRSVVVVETDAGRAAAWIGAVSHLLPVPLARRVSFATYHHRPSYSQLHLIGTVPDADIELGGTGFDEFYLFDIPSGRATELPVHPAADLLAELGTVAAARVWQRSTSLAAGDESTLDDWYPVTVAAAVLDGFAPGEPHLAAAAAWLQEQARRLGPEVVDTVGRALVEQSAGSPPQLRLLASAAARAGAAALLAAIQRQPLGPEADLLARCQSQPELRPQTLVEILALRGRVTGRPAPVDAQLLADVWPHGNMPCADLRQVLATLEPDPAVAGELRAPLSAALVRPLPTGEGQPLEEYVLLCQALQAHPVRRQLSRDARVALTQLRWVQEKVRWQRRLGSAEAVRTAAKDFVDGYEVLQPPVKAYVLAQLPGLLHQLEPDVLADVVAGCPPPVLAAFDAWQQRMEITSPSPEAGDG